MKDSVFLTKSEYLARQSVVADAYNSLDVKGLIKTVGKKGLGILVNSLLNMQYEVVESKDNSIFSAFVKLVQFIPVIGAPISKLFNKTYGYNNAKKGSIFIFDDF